MNKGKVYLVGAGPGDEGLITVKAVECIGQADVLIYDYLVNPVFLEYCSNHCSKIYVGKKAGAHTLSQDEINTLLVEQASKGLKVVRLKGGDPFIFGRGGEEALELVKNNISFEVVPGVTAGVAAAAYAGISLTQRGYTSTLAFITGHENTEKETSDIDWKGLAKSFGTLVFYMGVKNLPQITSKLIEHGKPENTPVALIRWGTYNHQQTITGTLKTICDEVVKNQFTPPCIIVIGEVVSLREQLRWFDNKPLFGKRIVVTRSRTQASSLSKKLRELGASVVEMPTIDIEPIVENLQLDQAITQINQYAWIIFTSVNAVEIFFKRLFDLSFDNRILHGVSIAVIGQETYNRLLQFGIKADLMPDTFTSDGIIDSFKSIHKKIIGKKLLLPGSDLAREIIPIELKKLGADVIHISTYHTTKPAYSNDFLEKLFQDEIDMFTFSSSSTVINLVNILKENGMEEKIKLINGASIGPITTQTAKENNIKIVLEPTLQTIPALVDSIENYFTK